MQFLKKVIIWILIIIVLLFSTLIVLSKVYEKKIIQFVQDEINTQYGDLVHVDSIDDVSFFNSFPSLSVTLTNLKVYELWKNKNKKHLAEIRTVYLNLNIYKLWLGDIVFNEIFCKEGYIDIKRGKYGDYNFISETDTVNSPLLLHINKLQLANINIQWQEYSKDKMSFLVHDVICSGDFFKDSYHFLMDGKITMDSIISYKSMLLNKPMVYIHSETYVDKITKNYQIQELMVTINNQISCSAKGYVVVPTENNFSYSLQFKTNEIDGNDFISYIQDSAVSKLVNNSAVKGAFLLNGSIEGSDKSIIHSSSQIEIVFKEMAFENDSLSISLQKISGILSVKNLNDNPMVQSNNITAKIDRGTIAVNGMYEFYNNSPRYNVNINFEGISMQAFAPWLNTSSFNIRSGSVIGSIKLLKNNISPMIFNINAQLQNFEGTIQNQSVKVFESSFIANNDSIYVQSLEGKIQDNPFDAKGVLYFTALHNKNRHNTFHVHFSKLNITPFLKVQESENNADSNRNSFTNHYFTNVNGNITIDYFEWNSIRAQNISVGLKSDLNQFHFNLYKTNAFSGELSGDLVYSNSTIVGKILLNEIQISDVFKQFNNFDQNYITDKHLYGNSKGYVYLKIPLDSTLTPIIPNIFIEANLSILNGQLKQFEPLQDMVAYIQNKKLYSSFLDYKTMSSKFKHILFEELNNTLYIQGGRVFIPKMNVITSAYSFEVEGEHAFNDSIRYQFNFYLSDLLKKKDATLEDGIWEIRENNKRFLKIPLLMTGTVDNPIFTLNKKDVSTSIQNEVVKEKATIKSMMKTDFGLFKQDSTVKKYQSTTPKNDLQFTHEEFNPQSAPNIKQTTTPTIKKHDIKKNTKEKEDFIPEEE